MAAAERWEYETILVQWNGDDWLVSFTDRDPIYGFQNALNHFGGLGWELVNAEAHRLVAVSDEAHSIGPSYTPGGRADTLTQIRTTGWEAYRYVCFFKRRAA